MSKSRQERRKRGFALSEAIIFPSTYKPTSIFGLFRDSKQRYIYIYTCIHICDRYAPSEIPVRESLREREFSERVGAMEEKLVRRLEAAVVRLEAISVGQPGGSPAHGGDAAAMDPSTVAYDDLISQYVGRVSATAEKIGGQVLDATKILAEAFAVQKELLVQVKQTQVRFSVFVSIRYNCIRTEIGDVLFG